MSQAADLNTSTAMPNRGNFAMQMEGLAIAGLYAVCFGWMHLNAGGDFVSVRVLTVFFTGLIAVPLVTGLTVFFIRRMVMNAIRSQPNIAAFATFASFALYALQSLLVYVVTREAYNYLLVGN